MDHHLLQSWIEQLVEEKMEVIVQEIRIFAGSISFSKDKGDGHTAVQPRRFITQLELIIRSYGYGICVAQVCPLLLLLRNYQVGLLTPSVAIALGRDIFCLVDNTLVELLA
jgi:hypothetical protein